MTVSIMAFSIKPWESIVDVTLVELAPTKIVSLRHIGSYGASVGTFWADVFNPWIQSQGLGNRVMYGIGQDDPCKTPPEKCRYDACVEAPETFVATGNAVVTTLPGGRYGIAQFRGTSEQVGNAWNTMVGDWLPNSGLQLDNRPCFERYGKDSEVDSKTGAFSFEICITVKSM